MKDAITSIDLGKTKPARQGKVRTIYELPDNRLLIVATDRISAFDVVMPTGIPGKGIILTQISNFWFKLFTGKIQHHLLETEFSQFPADLHPYKEILDRRSVIVKKVDVVPFECVVRGYISGSLWKAYSKGEKPYGIALPENLKESDKFPEPLFTPTTKADCGHDMPVTFEEMKNEIGTEMAEYLRDKSLAIYSEGDKYAREQGIILADTKFEFGLDNGVPILIDEVLTPDSSRFWPIDRYEPGRSQESFDKQFVRDYLAGLDWGRTPPGPELAEDVVKSTRLKYLEAYRRLTGQDLEL